MKRVRGGLRGKSKVGGTTRIRVLAKGISTAGSAKEIRSVVATSPQYTDDSRQISGNGDAPAFGPVPKLTVVLPSKKLTLKEDRLVSGARTGDGRGGGRDSPPAQRPLIALQAQAWVVQRSRVAAFRLPRINTEFEINVNAKPKGYRRTVENRPQYSWLEGVFRWTICCGSS